MPLTTPDIKALLTSYNTCSNLYFIDTTGAYNAISNPLGYGLPGGLSTSDITSSTLILNYNSLGVTAEFEFTVSANVITAATLSFAGASPATDILASLQSTTFPFTEANPFNFLHDYGVTLPDLSDQVFTVEYTINGTVGGDGFSYEAQDSLLISCNTEQCNRKAFIDAGWNTEKLAKAYRVDTFIRIAQYGVEEGQIDNAVASIQEASDLCNCECEGCQ